MEKNTIAPLLPRDQANFPIQLAPAVVSLACTTNDSVTTSSVVTITLNSATSFFSVTSISNGVFMSYSDTVSNIVYDEYIAAGVSQDFVRPNSITKISFIGDGATAKIRVIQK